MLPMLSKFNLFSCGFTRLPVFCVPHEKFRMQCQTHFTIDHGRPHIGRHPYPSPYNDIYVSEAGVGDCHMCNRAWAAWLKALVGLKNTDTGDWNFWGKEWDAVELCLAPSSSSGSSLELVG